MPNPYRVLLSSPATQRTQIRLSVSMLRGLRGSIAIRGGEVVTVELVT